MDYDLYSLREIYKNIIPNRCKIYLIKKTALKGRLKFFYFISSFAKKSTEPSFVILMVSGFVP